MESIWIVLGIASVLAIIVWMVSLNSSVSQRSKDLTGGVAIIIVVVLFIIYFVNHHEVIIR